MPKVSPEHSAWLAYSNRADETLLQDIGHPQWPELLTQFERKWIQELRARFKRAFQEPISDAQSTHEYYRARLSDIALMIWTEKMCESSAKDGRGDESAARKKSK